MGWTPPEHEGVRDWQNFDTDDMIRAGAIITSLLLKDREVFIRKSASGRGFHIVVNRKPDLIERWILKDCWGRYTGDLKRKKVGKPIGILFGFKNMRYTSRWKRVRAVGWAELLAALEMKRAEMFKKCMEARA